MAHEPKPAVDMSSSIESGKNDAPDFNVIGRTERRLVPIALMIGVQAVALRFSVHPQSPDYDGAYEALGMAGQPVTYFLMAFVLLLSTHLGGFWRTLLSYSHGHRWLPYLIPQLACYFAVFIFAGKLMPTDLFQHPELRAQWRPVWLGALALASAGTSALSLLLIAPVGYWRHFLASEKIPLTLAVLFALGAFYVSKLSQYSWESWDYLNAWTMGLAGAMLGMFYSDIRMDIATHVLGTADFSVIINYQCSGYEGLGLVAAFLTWYLLAFKDELKFPNVFLLFPFGMLTIWLFNCARIALLIAVGSSVSPEIAIEGFHSNAGWISFILVSVGIMFAARRMRFFAAAASHRSLAMDPDKAHAIPLLVLFATTLVSSAFSPEFPWLYPVRVLATGAAIWLLWRHFRPHAWSVDRWSILAGIGVFVVWIALVPHAEERDAQLADTLFAAPLTVSTGWMLFRVVGAMLTVPIAEELGFRRYLLTLFPQALLQTRRANGIQWIPMVVSSTAFGLFHQAWLAGAIAGVVYYLVSRYRGQIWDAIVAHITTNFLLVTYAAMTGYWSYL